MTNKSKLQSLRSSPRTPFSFGTITPVAGTLKSVSLSDWWLTRKAKENSLSVAGIESKGGSLVRRQFSSAAISKRHDSTTLETSDGITVCINGVINRSRTLENGISSDVCNRFLLGFPYNWKNYHEDKKDFNISFYDIPAHMVQDFLMTSSSSLTSKILGDVVDSLRDLVCPTKTGHMDKRRLSTRPRKPIPKYKD